MATDTKRPPRQIRPPESIRAGILRLFRDAPVWLRKHRQELGPDDTLHQCRVAIKRFRGYLRLLGESLPAEEYKRLNSAFRDLAKSMSAARDGKVAVDTLDLLIKQGGGSARLNALQRTADRLRETRKNRPSRLRPGRVAIGRRLDQMEALAGDLLKTKLSPSGWPLIRGGLKRTYRQGRAHLHEWLALGEGLVEAHEFRKQAKYLMFQIEFLVPRARGRKIERMRADLKDLEQALGALNDCVVLGSILKRESRGKSPFPKKDLNHVTSAIADRMEKCHEFARESGVKVFRPKPGKFVDNVVGKSVRNKSK